MDEKALRDLNNALQDNVMFTIKPTKLIMVPYPDETEEEFAQRCAVGQQLARSLL